MTSLQLRQHILDELEFEPRVNAANIGVAVEKGVVTLTGHVTSYEKKLATVRAVRRIKGVRAIADDIEIRFDDGKKTVDDEIAKRAVDILEWDAVVPNGWIQVTVRDGWITLNGDVDWYFQKQSAEDGVRKLSGVRGVINNIAIKPGVQVQDVKRRIEDALKRNAEIEAKDIRVTVSGSKVTLAGTIHDWVEHDAIKNAAWSAPGVQSVEDRLTMG